MYLWRLRSQTLTSSATEKAEQSRAPQMSDAKERQSHIYECDQATKSPEQCPNATEDPKRPRPLFLAHLPERWAGISGATRIVVKTKANVTRLVFALSRIQVRSPNALNVCS